MGKEHSRGYWLIKGDHILPVAGSVKARGGIYEVLLHAESLALKEGFLSPNEDPVKLACQEAREFFAHYQVAVGSPGNLGLSVGVMAAALGFHATVHMSAGAKSWKKERLRARGVEVISPMPPLEPFKFVHIALPSDGDLQLILAECMPAENSPSGVPAYSFGMQALGGEYMGRIRLRVGWSEDVIRYAGHVGYVVDPAHRYAERACRLIMPLAKHHGMTWGLLRIAQPPQNGSHQVRRSVHQGATDTMFFTSFHTSSSGFSRESTAAE